MSITTDAQDLFEQFTVAQLRDMIQTEGGVAAPSKLRKHELAQYLADIRHNQAKEQESYAATVGEPQVYQGAMHEAAELDDFNAWRNTPLADLPGEMPENYVHPENATRLAAAATRLGNSLEKISEATRKAAQALVPVAYGRMTATVQSMGRTVRGKVAAVELRTPDADGSGRVLLVVQHDGHPHRRTLHRLVDVKLEPVTS